MRLGLAAAALVGLVVPGEAQRVSYEGGLLASSGRYLFTETTTTVALSTGLAIDHGPVTLRLAWPVWLHDNRLVTSSGIGAMPTGGTRAGMGVGDSSVARRMRRAGRGGPVAVPTDAIAGYSVHAADPVLQAGARLVSSPGLIVRVTGSVKLPVADTATVGTGRWDAGGGLRVSIPSGQTLVGFDASFWHFGDLPDVDFRDVVNGGVSVGRIGRSGWGWLASASASTTIIDGFDPPVSLGGSVSRVAGRSVYGLSLALGLTEMAPDLSVGSFWSVRF